MFSRAGNGNYLALRISMSVDTEEQALLHLILNVLNQLSSTASLGTTLLAKPAKRWQLWYRAGYTTAQRQDCPRES